MQNLLPCQRSIKKQKYNDAYHNSQRGFHGFVAFLCSPSLLLHLLKLKFFRILGLLDPCFIHKPMRLLIVIEPNLRPAELTEHEISVAILHRKIRTTARAFYRPCHKSTSYSSCIKDIMCSAHSQVNQGGLTKITFL